MADKRGAVRRTLVPLDADGIYHYLAVSLPDKLPLGLNDFG
jgi:hypothetical protein